MKEFLTACGLFIGAVAIASLVAIYVGATVCPPGRVAVKDALGWPVCVAGERAP